MIPATHATDVVAIEEVLKLQASDSCVFTTAVLIPSGSNCPTLVEVPSREGLSPRAGSLVLSDVDFRDWLDQGNSEAASSLDLKEVSRTVLKCSAAGGISLPTPMTVVVCPQPFNLATPLDDIHHTNRLVMEHVPGLQTSWKGNVLVFINRSKQADGFFLLRDAKEIDVSLAAILHAFDVPPPSHVLPDRVSDVPFAASGFKRARQLVFLRFRIFLAVFPLHEEDRQTPIQRALYQACREIVVQWRGGETDSMLMGSAILQLLTLRGEEELRGLRNLNILIPYAAVLQWRRLFQQQLGFRLVCDEAVPEYLSQSCSSCLKFSKGTSMVLCTVARPANMLRALLAARTTSQMNIMTGNCVLSFYPSLTVRRLSLLGWPAQASGATTYEAMTGRAPPLSDIIRYSDGSAWTEPCGRDCRRLMRLTTGYKGVGKFFWAEDPGNDIAYESESVLWFLAINCVNPACPE
ncbi:hypothetical protein R3P38DRAFT_3182498 [Favolaschia claudopus]|uniref:Uncharacterized protein n=1 Tax=Favolaschia claudopus TaxID=2862362 RepID=A0AAW0CJJ6_9AGAR